MKTKILIGAVFLFILFIGFNSIFLFTSFEKFYLESVSAKYCLKGIDLKNKIENGTRTGNRITFNYLKSQLSETKQEILSVFPDSIFLNAKRPNANFSEKISISLALPNGLTLYSTDKQLENSKTLEFLIGKFKKILDAGPNSKKWSSIKHQGNFFFLIPIYNESGETNRKSWINTIIIGIDAKFLKLGLADFHTNSIKLHFLFLGYFILLLILLLELMILKTDDHHNFSKRKISFCVIAVILLAQTFFYALNFKSFNDHFIQSTVDNAKIITSSFAKNEDLYPIDKRTFSDNIDPEGFIQNFIDSTPGIRSVTIFKNNNQFFIDRSNSDETSSIINPPKTDFVLSRLKNFIQEYDLRIDLIPDKESDLYILFKITNKHVLAELSTLLLDFLTIVILSILFFIELVILFLLLINGNNDAQVNRSQIIDYNFIRPAAFFFIFGIDISLSFIPLHVTQLYSPIAGLPKNMVMGLPISVEFLFVGISIYLSGLWNDRRGWHEPFLFGLILAAIGNIYSCAAASIIPFIVSRALVGVGYGLLLLAAQGFVIRYSNARSKTQSLAQLISGIYAGSICGGATGALLADRIGYRPVFLIGSFILFAVIGYAFLFMRNAMQKPMIPKINLSTAYRKSNFLPFIKNKLVLALILLSSLPASIAAVGFLNYFSPIYLNSIGASQSTIGRVLMIYGVSLIYIGPIISRRVDASTNKRYFIFFGCLLASLTFLLFYLFTGIFAAVIAVFMLGLSSCFVIAAQSSYLLNLRVTRNFGEGKAIAIFRASSRIGQAVGPLIFSAVIMGSNIKHGITQLGLFFLLTALLFLLLTQKDHIYFERYKDE